MRPIQKPLAAIAASLLLVPVLAETPAGNDPRAAEAKQITGEFFTALKGELQAAITEGGPVKAIAVCKERAPAIARALAAETGWDVARTSLKVRNPDNAPDAWERQVLQEFEKRKAAGEDVETMAFAEEVETDGGKRYRFMKAIPTSALCLTCHGETLDPALAAAIDAAYPVDQARGFALGDIRGAFTLAKPL